MRVRLLGLAVGIALVGVASAALQRTEAAACSCTARPHIGFRDAECECFTQSVGARVVGLMTEFLDLGSKAVPAGQSCSCSVEVAQGYNNGQCTCTASLVQCPEHSAGHPICVPDHGYSGVVVWDPKELKYVTKDVDGNVVDALTRAECPEKSDSWPDCSCISGYAGDIEYVKTSTSYSGSCKMVDCLEHSHGAPTCACDKGYKETTKVEFSMTARKWLGACTKIDCPTNAVADSFSDCTCKLGYKGSTKWAGSDWVDECILADCPEHSSHDGAVCKCNRGWFDADSDKIVFNFTSQAWQGSCEKRDCPANTENHPNCTAEKGFLGDCTWNAAKETFEGSPTRAVCPTGGTGDDCACLNGYVSDPLAGPAWTHGEGWKHTCTVKGCPIGSDVSRPTSCQCDETGYTGTLKWDGQEWGSCSEVACPEHSHLTPINGVKACTCDIGYAGAVTWAPETRLWVSTCKAVECPAHAACGSQSANCTKGFKNVVVWNQAAQRWDSTCQAETCPDGSSGFPDCTCNTGYSGGDKDGALTWLALGTDSKWASGCTLVSCPAESTKNPDGSCTCNFGYGGALAWKRPVYDGECKAAACPVNATGNGPTCACPKGFLPSGDYAFREGEWHGTCEYQDCGKNTKNWPDCICVDGAYYANGGTAITWSSETGYSGNCILWPCPTDASPVGTCDCHKGYASYINGAQVSVTSSWNTLGRWNHDCRKVSCPTGADPEEHPNCACKVGYRGHPEWDSKKGTWSTCVEVECNDGANLVRGTGDAASQCVCKVGYAGSVLWNSKNQTWNGVCTKAPCPPNAICEGGEAACTKGYSGKVTWAGSAWESTCKAVPCSPNSSGFPDCACNVGWAGGMLSWDGNAYGSCTYVECPGNADRLPSGQCMCKLHYSGSPQWTGNSYVGNCTLAPCPEHGGQAPHCHCIRAFRASPDFGWSNNTRKWEGTCQEAPCPGGAISREDGCACKIGFRGTILWKADKGEFAGTCSQIPCPDFSSGEGCICYSGYTGLPTWDGLNWKHSCTPVECAPHSTKVDLGTFGYKCECDVPFKNRPIWSGTSFTNECVEVECPAHSVVKTGDPSTCSCDDGFVGTPKWNAQLQNYDAYCSPVNCPAPAITGGDTCVCPRGFTGDCSWKDNDWDCNCGPQDCPANAAFNQASKFCVCNKGYAGTLGWDDAKDTYTGECTKVTCVSGVANSSGHPNCGCDVGFAGTVTWDDDKDVYTGACNKVDCPEFAEEHPKCTCKHGYRGRNAKTDPVRWNAGLQAYDGGCEAIPCPAHGGSNPPNCDCEKGYAPHNMAIVGEDWQGTCEIVACPNNMGVHPNCNCTTGYKNYIQWDQARHRYDTACEEVDCPDNASGEPACECDDGYKGTPNFDAAKQTWDFTCPAVECPEHSAGHPRCECTPGYQGTITWERATRSYNGKCDMVPCPAGSRRRAAKVNKEALITGCDCYTGCAGGYDWLTTAYTGSCTCKPCPDSGDCSDLKSNPAVEVVAFPCVKGFTGSVDWDGSNWVDNCKALACPANSDSHPECACSVGYRGTVGYEKSWNGVTTTASYKPTCTFVPCPDNTMSRSTTPQGLPLCTCQVGFAGVATWNKEKQQFDGATVCSAVSCPDDKMIKDTTRTKCDCPVNHVGKASWVQENQRYEGDSTCTVATCPEGATCNDDGNERKCDTFYKGYYGWDAVSQSWVHNCSLVDCITHSKRLPFVNGDPQGCTCTVGFTMNPVWLETVQGYSGCDSDAKCPSQTDDSKKNVTTGAPLCPCLPGFSGHPAWDFKAATYTHKCRQVPCPAGSVRGRSTLCDCEIGYVGKLTWHETDQFYQGECIIADCPKTGVDCTNAASPENRDPLEELPCLDGYKGKVVWDFTNQLWSNQCTLVPCPEHSVRTSDSSCECAWGYTGAVTWGFVDRQYTSTCKYVECPAPSTDSGDGHCLCPPSTEDGSCSFNARDAWSCSCGGLTACPDNSAGNIDCKCNVGFRGVLGTDPKVTTDDKPQTTTVRLQTSRTGSCAQVPCPANSRDRTFPSCSCASGYEGAIKWVDSSASWNSTCAVAACPEHASGGPACACDKGYLGTPTWNYATQKYDGTCTLAVCPAHATAGVDAGVPSCGCDVGYRGVEIWDAVKGWTHTCEFVACPALSTKITSEIIKYVKYEGYTGCHEDTKNLGLVKTLSCQNSAEECEKQGKNACDAMVHAGDECWGFALHESGEIELYNSLALAQKICGRPYGLTRNPKFNTFQRQSLRVGDCRCVEGHMGKFVWQGSEYTGACELVTCPSNSECSTTVDCNKGFKGSSSFKWNFDNEVWEGSCVAQECPAHSKAGTFPDCLCDLGYQGGHNWDDTNEVYTGACTALDCPANSDNNFPSCKCNNGFVRNDDAANSIIQWKYDTQTWQHTCKAVPCPKFSDKVTGGNCSCSIGYKGKPVFDSTTASYIVNESGDYNACVLVDCPANSRRVGSACVCKDGWKGDLNWNPFSYTWGVCTLVDCPLHSHGHPNCACDSGYSGSIDWAGDQFKGTCAEISTTPVWDKAGGNSITDAHCVRLQGPHQTLATSSTDKPPELSFKFGGVATDVSIVRCEIKMNTEFTKVRGSFLVTPTSTKLPTNNYMIMQWNSSVITPAKTFIAFGTPYTIVDPGKESGTGDISYSEARTITIPESTVTQSDTIRFEVSQPFGVDLTISNIDLTTYNQLREVVNCTRTTTGAL